MTAVDRLPSHLKKKGCYYEVSVFVITTLYIFIMAERVGFEPTVRCRITGFQDRLLKPLGHLSIQYLCILSKRRRRVNSCAFFAMHR